MADLNVALLLRLVDKATGPARAVMERVNRMSGGSFGKHADLMGRGSRQMAGGMGDLVHHTIALIDEQHKSSSVTGTEHGAGAVQ